MPEANKSALPLQEALERLLFHRPDLARRRQQRREARDVCSWIGSSAPAVDVLAGWLGANGARQVSDLTTALDRLHRAGGDSLAPISGTPREFEPDRELLAFKLGWDGLPSGPPREFLLTLGLLRGTPLPRHVTQTASRATGSDAEVAMLSGFCVSDDPRGLYVTDPCLVFLSSQAGSDLETQQRCLQLVLAVRDWIPGAWRESDDVLRGPVEFATQLVEQADQADLLASLCHRMAERSRKRGRWEAAGGWLQRAERVPGQSEAYAELLDVERAIVLLEAGHEQEGLIRLDDWLGRHDSRSTARTVTPQLVDRVRLFRALALARAGRRGIAEAELRALFHFGSGSKLADTDEAGTPLAKSVRQDPARLMALHALGTLLVARDELDDGLVCLSRAVEEWTESISSDDPALPTLNLGLAQALRQAHRNDEAEAILEQARVLAGGDMDRPAQAALPLILHELGILATEREDWPTATTLLDEARMMADTLLPNRHPVRAQVHYSRGLMHLSAGDADRAERELVQALDIRAAELGEDRPAVGLARAALGWARAHQEESRRPMARDDLRAGHDLVARALGPDSPEALQIEALLAKL